MINIEPEYIIAIGFGGVLGAIFRYLLSIKNNRFPWGTFMTNFLGSFLMGLFGGIFVSSSIERHFLCIGFVGSLTTFSTFINDVFELKDKKATIEMIVYISLSVVLCFIAVVLGISVANRF